MKNKNLCPQDTSRVAEPRFRLDNWLLGQCSPSLPSPHFQATRPWSPWSQNSYLWPTPPCELLALRLMVTLGPTVIHS